MNYVGHKRPDPLTVVLYPSDGAASGTFYEDAGEGYEHLDGAYARRAITCEVEGAHIRVVVGEQEGSFVPARRRVRFELREIASEPTQVEAEGASAAWRYDPEERRLVVDMNATAAAQSIAVSLR
jgi:alpha-glucosidase (family GH31 glycosyl hydrolase)